MHHRLKEYDKYVEITGYKNADFNKANAFLTANRQGKKENIEVQFFDAEVIATREHLLFATLNALQAFRGGTNISKSLAMETILYASGQRQIQRAIQLCGIKPETKNVAVIILADTQRKLDAMLKSISLCFNVEPDESVLDLSDFKRARIKRVFEISEDELATVVRNDDFNKAMVDLVIERIALLSTQL